MSQELNHPAACPECGTAAMDGLDCWGMLGVVLGWEWDDPALAAEHFLTVASYNLQHPAQFTDEALLWLRAGFVERLDRGTAPVELRRRAARQFEGSSRVLRPTAERHPVSRPWRLTIAAVYQAGQAGGAAARVQGWAAAIRQELPP
jgi:hypothetical protein